MPHQSASLPSQPRLPHFQTDQMQVLLASMQLYIDWQKRGCVERDKRRFERSTRAHTQINSRHYVFAVYRSDHNQCPMNHERIVQHVPLSPNAGKAPKSANPPEPDDAADDAGGDASGFAPPAGRPNASTMPTAPPPRPYLGITAGRIPRKLCEHRKC